MVRSPRGSPGRFNPAYSGSYSRSPSPPTKRHRSSGGPDIRCAPAQPSGRACSSCGAHACSLLPLQPHAARVCGPPPLLAAEAPCPYLHKQELPAEGPLPCAMPSQVALTRAILIGHQQLIRCCAAGGHPTGGPPGAMDARAATPPAAATAATTPPPTLP